jgi:hypothetical protein
MGARRAGALALAGTVALVVALTLSGVANGRALLAYVLFLAALLLALLVGRIRAVLPLASDLETMLPGPSPRGGRVEQIEKIKSRIALASFSESDLYLGLGPLVRDVVAARLSRRYGVDLEREPERAAALLGKGLTWELIQPHRWPSGHQFARGWSQRELEELVEQLERL